AIVQEALRVGGGSVQRVVVLSRDRSTTDGPHMSWDEFLRQNESGDSSHAIMEANEPAFILATSGTTAKPKLAVHTHGGYQVYVHSMGRWMFGMRPDDVWWSTSDIGWGVGHSYIVYAPLLAGGTTVAHGAALDQPAPDIVWRAVEAFAIPGIFTSPTAVRLLMRYGEEHARNSDVSSLERVFCAGEVLNPPALEWLQDRVLAGRVPVIDHM